jgi:protein-tyrosine phosphatase
VNKYGPRSADGGVDRLLLPPDGGELWMCGKHAIGPDVGAALERANGATTVVCLNERHELDERYPAYVRWLDANVGGAAIWHPIADLHVPTLDAASGLVASIVGRLDGGNNVLMHCAAGIGRTGATAAMVAIARGFSVAEALDIVARSRPMAGPEVGAQRDLVNAYADRHHV